ncbi:hypothetical protein B0H14DRAFT_2614909 [Mycena olivaceomarginata]|nr:hypothetical protein B0H14DRAFT_2614909 [Mycena olivaceomarginata]
MPKKARAVLARTQNLPGQTNKGSKPLSDTVDNSDLQTADIASQAKKPNGNVGGTCEDTSTPEETGNPHIPRYIPSQLDPDLIEIIGRFEMMDEDPSDGLAPEPHEDLSSDDEDEADETEIQDLSVLERFSATLLRAQQIAVAKEQELEKSRKHPRTYTKNSKRTNERNRKRFCDLQAKGFASVAKFFPMCATQSASAPAQRKPQWIAILSVPGRKRRAAG